MSFKRGDRVVVKRTGLTPAEVLGREFTVSKINPKNVRCDAVDGGRGINWPKDQLLPATPENLAAQRVAVTPTATEFFQLGEIVTLRRPYKDITPTTPMVVTGDSAKYVRVVRLGGDGGRYVRVPHGGLERRDTVWLAMVFAGQAPPEE